MFKIIPATAFPSNIFLSVSSNNWRKKKFKCFGKIHFHGDVFKSILNAGLPHPFLFWYQSNRQEKT